MNLKNNQITIGELYSNPQVYAILQKEYPKAVNHPFVRIAWNMTLEKAVGIARGYVPGNQVDMILKRLREL